MASKRLDKPFGVYAWTILIVIGYALLPFLGPYGDGRNAFFISLGALPFNGSLLVFEGADGQSPFILIFITILLRVMTGAAAVWAFVGHNEGRISLLGFVSVNYIWWMLLTVIILSNNDIEANDTITIVSNLIRPTIWIGILWWYFTKKDVVAYYKQES